MYVLNLVLRPFQEVTRAEMYYTGCEATKGMGRDELRIGDGRNGGWRRGGGK